MLAAILLFSLSSPLHTTETVAIDSHREKSLTSNNTGEDSAVQTLVSNLNIYDSADITGTVDSMDRAHVVWVQGNNTASLNYALFNINGEQLIGTTQLLENPTQSITVPKWQSIHRVGYTSSGSMETRKSGTS